MRGSRKFLFVFAFAGALMAQSIFHKAPPEVEEALRARVTEFYKLYQQAKFRQAEAYVAEEYRDMFYGMKKSAIKSFEFIGMEFSDDFQSAKVTVKMPTYLPIARTLLSFPVTTKWKVIAGQWYLVFEKREASPFGPIKPAEESAPVAEGPVKLPSFQRPTIESITTGGFKVEPRKLQFPRGELTSRAVAVTNNMPGEIMLSLETNDLPGLGVVMPVKGLQANSQITFQLTYDPKVGKLRGTREIKLWIQPLNQPVTIQLIFE